MLIVFALRKSAFYAPTNRDKLSVLGMVAPRDGATPSGSVGDRYRLMRPEEGADVAHRQRDLVLGVLPRVQAHLRVRREMHGLHRDGGRVPRHVVRQDQYLRLAVAHKIEGHGI